MNNLQMVQMMNILHKFENKKLPQKIGYIIMKNLMQLQNEYVLYEKQLKKLFNEYDEHIQKNAENEIIYKKNGLPIVNDDCAEIFYKELENIVNAEVDIEIYKIDKKYFDYDDCAVKYDPLTPIEIMELMSVLT